MTQSLGGMSPGWEAQAIAEYADRLGLVWKLRPGSAVSPSTDDPTGTGVILDGDTEVLNAYSLIGLVGGGERVMCMVVPPSGLYIIGRVGGTPSPATVKGALAATAGTLYTINTGSETNLTELRLENCSVDADFMYAFQGSIYLGNGGSPGDSWQFLWREDTPLVGTVVAEFYHISVTAGFTDTVDYDASYRPSATGLRNFYLSATRLAGAGTITVIGSSRSHSRLTRLGTFSGPAPEFVSR